MHDGFANMTGYDGFSDKFSQVKMMYIPYLRIGENTRKPVITRHMPKPVMPTNCLQQASREESKHSMTGAHSWRKSNQLTLAVDPDFNPSRGFGYEPSDMEELNALVKQGITSPRAPAAKRAAFIRPEAVLLRLAAREARW
jgi:hypothetical protein